MIARLVRYFGDNEQVRAETTNLVSGDMDNSYIEKHFVVDRFVQGKLSESEVAEFEERMVWDQALVDEVRLVERLRDGLRHTLSDDPGVFRRQSARGRALEFLTIPRLALAASVLLIVSLTYSFWLGAPGTDNGVAWNPPGITNVLRLDVVRSTSLPAINLERDAWTVLLVDAPLRSSTEFFDSYRVTIRPDREDAEAIWAQDRLKPSYEDSLAIGIAGSALRSGSYVLSIEALQESGIYEPVQRIPFQTYLQ